MKISTTLFRNAIVLTLIVCATSMETVAQRPQVRIGILLDGPWERNEQIRSAYEREITQLLEGEFDVQFPAAKYLTVDWTAKGVAAGLDRLLADPEVDLILTLGVLGSNDAGHRGPLPKPVLAPYILRPQLQGIPFEIVEQDVPGRGRDRVRVSGVPNFSYVDVGTNLLREVSAFLEIVPFKHLTMLTMRAFVEGIPELADNVVEELRPLNLELNLVSAGASLDEALASIPPETEAVYVAPLLQLPPGDFDRLVEALIERKLPSFSLWGRSEVEAGLLASLSVDKLDTRGGANRLARRVALNMHRILLGERAQDLPIDFEQEERLTINIATARVIDVYPSFSLLTEAELLNDVRTEATRSLSLSQVILEASRVNLDLAVADRTVAAGFENVREARSGLRPQLEVSGVGLFIDKDRAQASFGSQGQAQVSGSLGASQLIYSEQVRANYDIERNLQDAREEERSEIRLDVILEAAQSYLNVLRAKTVERIQKDNLRLTRSNLDLAQSRVDLGAAGREEVFRWESQIATNRKDVIEAGAQRNQAEIAVNRVLNQPIEESFLTAETALDDPQLVTGFEQIRPYIENRQAFRIFREFMVQEAFEASPELKRLDNAVLAQQRALLATKRAFYVPTVGVQAEVLGFKNGGAGRTAPGLSPDIPFSFPMTNSLNWTVAVNATLPLFQGGALRARRGRAEIELDQLTVQHEATRQRVEQRIRSVLHQSGASFVGIELSRDAAEAARKNLEIVQDAYSQGVVNIITLLDAQNQALVAELVAANAIFDYLLDLMDAQRAIGRFDYYRSDADREAFLERLNVYFRQAGYRMRER